MIKVKLIVDLNSIRYGTPFDDSGTLYYLETEIPTQCMQLGTRIKGIIQIEMPSREGSRCEFPTWKVVGLQWDEPDNVFPIELELVSHKTKPEMRAAFADLIKQTWD